MPNQNFTLTIPGDLPTTLTTVLNALKGVNVDVNGVTYEVAGVIEHGEGGTDDGGYGLVTLLGHPWSDQEGDAIRTITTPLPITTDTTLAVC